MERLSHKKPPVENKEYFLREMVSWFERGQIFLTALELDLFTKLKEPKTADALSMEMGTHYEITCRFLDVLVALGVLVKHEDRYLTAPDVAPFLVEGEPYFAKFLKSAVEERDVWMKLKQILKEGHSVTPTPKHAKFDRESINWLARGVMLGRLQATLKIVSELPEFQNAKRLIDLGGGHGLYSIAFAQENPGLEATVFDLPGVTDAAEEYINEYGMQDRVRTMAGDFTRDSIGSGYDIAFEAHAFGGNKDEMRLLYQKVSDALNDNGLFISETHTLDDDRTGPPVPLIWELKNYMTGRSKTHLFPTNGELFDIFREVGLSGERVINLPSQEESQNRMVIARKRI